MGWLQTTKERPSSLTSSYPRPIPNANWPCPMPLSRGVTAALLWRDMQAVAMPNPQAALSQRLEVDETSPAHRGWLVLALGEARCARGGGQRRSCLWQLLERGPNLVRSRWNLALQVRFKPKANTGAENRVGSPQLGTPDSPRRGLNDDGNPLVRRPSMTDRNQYQRD